MRAIRGFWFLVLSVCLVGPVSTHVFAGGGGNTTSKAKKEAHRKPTRPDLIGGPRETDEREATDGGPNSDKVTEYQNALGQTVYSVAASQFDISPPLLEMAAAAGVARAMTEVESPTRAIGPGDSLASGTTSLAAPTIGFNFAGVAFASVQPSDSNGSVGNNQFVEVVNTRYQVWSLNRSTQVATSILGPANLSTLWAGFGGDCEAVGSYPYADPIVLYDKIANRWLIAQFSLHQGLCVALSTSANATGTYARYFFDIPIVLDYQKLGVWTDAYYMWSRNANNGPFIYAALERAKMLAANPAATWQMIQDASSQQGMPADIDGFALPPTGAAGIFVWAFQNSLHIERMKVNFTTPSLTTKTVQAIVPVSYINYACVGGSLGPCIPQPGTTNSLNSLGEYVMFRAAYRNYIDHESLVVSRSVDPSVGGVAAGVRWQDIRLSGAPNAKCPIYPCLYQEGTIADLPNGRSRWLPSIAMDSAENILVGYSATGKTDGVENHSQRYTGRAKGDPPGLMTVPETTIVTGTANNTVSHLWGDYASMSIDPADDCTFWYVSQYYATQNSWSTRIVSAAFPAGSGAGQCAPSTCTARPTGVPTIGTATVPGDNQITVTWTGITPTPGAYAIERADGLCGGSLGPYRPLAATAGSASSFTDTTVMGGRGYAYKVRAAADASGRCQAQNVSNGCASATATGPCTLKPSFAGATSAVNSQGTNCGVTVRWTATSSLCPLTPGVRYNIFRSSLPDFVPSAANRIATCVVGPNSYLDTDNLQSGTTYYYVVRAEDGSTGNGGECGGGNEESNSVVVSATPYAAGMQTTPGTWSDGAGDGSAFLQRWAGVIPISDPVWRLVKTADDPEANHTPGGAYAYRNAGPAAGDTYMASTCAEMRTPPLTIGGATVNLKYWERHQIEYHRDAVAVEYSVNGGPPEDVPAPSNNAADGCDASDDTTSWEPLSCTGITTTNACSFADTKLVFSGPLGGGDSCANFATSAGVSPYAHRCHQITGLTAGDTIQVFWRSSSDEASDYAGFYLDDVAVTNVLVPNVCVPDTCSGQANGTACSDGNACTSGDSCDSGRCSPGSSSTPVETTNVSAASDKATYSWSAVASAIGYDVVRGGLGTLPVGPGGSDEICFDDLAGPTLVDTDVPASGTGYWYLSRGENACGIGTFGQQSNGMSRATTTCP